MQHRWVYVFILYINAYLPNLYLRYAINTTTSARAPVQVMSGITALQDRLTGGKRRVYVPVHRAAQCKPLRHLRRDCSCSCCRRCWRYLCRQIVHYIVRVYRMYTYYSIMYTKRLGNLLRRFASVFPPSAPCVNII